MSAKWVDLFDETFGFLVFHVFTRRRNENSSRERERRRRRRVREGKVSGG
jgi:hypothetical protein